jgi:hypothetical protein
MNLNHFVLNETIAAAHELGRSLSETDAQKIAEGIVTRRFPVCVRDYLQNIDRGE